MGLTLLLGCLGCILLFLAIWGVTVTLPTRRLAANFPKDVQEALKPRLDALPFTWKRVLGFVILVGLIAAYLGLFIVGGLDGKARGFTFLQFFVRFLVIGGMIKAFDIIGLDYFLLTKTHFFQHYFPETEGCAGWKNFGYNRAQQLRQIILTVLGSLAMAWLFSHLA